MAEVNAKDLTTKTTPASTDSMLLFGTTSNEGAKITVDNLADNILGRLTTKTFANQVGGSSAATLLAQLNTLNSNMPSLSEIIPTAESGVSSVGKFFKYGRLVVCPVQLHAIDAVIPANTVLLTGLPAALQNSYCIIGNASVYELIGVKNVDGSGVIYSLSNIQTSWCYGVLVYASNT